MEIGPQDHCVRCWIGKEEIRNSQQYKEPIFCATVDSWGETIAEYPRHKFVWTAKNQAQADREARDRADMFAWMEAP